MEDGLVEITRAYDYTEAEIIRSALEASGFYCVLYGGNHMRIQPHLQIALGGIKIMVRESQAGEARAFVEAIQADNPTSPAPALPTTPKGIFRSFISFILFFLAGAPMPIKDRFKKDHE
ncbi:MAG: DUF2007 domain-containing protein [Alphaproteobacteria bacterium]|nr:DUF2007 domain-containing protein [Alphaproteobacteria bacterium]